MESTRTLLTLKPASHSKPLWYLYSKASGLKGKSSILNICPVPKSWMESVNIVDILTVSPIRYEALFGVMVTGTRK